MKCFIVLRRSNLDKDYPHHPKPIAAFAKEKYANELIKTLYEKDKIELKSKILLSLIEYKVEEVDWNGDC